jgi:hypothetical protein
MPRHALRVLLTASITASLVAVSTASASAQTTGSETFDGFLLTSGASGERQVLASPIVATGVFTGVGRLVEVQNLPSDPDNVSRDDLVFRRGTFHLVSENGDVSSSLNPETCRFTVTVEQSSRINGGTGAFADASGSFTASVHAFGVTARNADGSCSEEVAPLRELDVVNAAGSLTF